MHLGSMLLANITFFCMALAQLALWVSQTLQLHRLVCRRVHAVAVAARLCRT